MSAPTITFDCRPGDDNEVWEISFAKWEHVVTDGLFVTAGALIAWVPAATAPTLGSITVGTDNDSLLLPVDGFTDGTKYHGRFTVTFTGGIKREFDVLWKCRIPAGWV